MAQGQSRTVMAQGRIVWTVGRSVFEGRVKTIYGTQTPQLDQQGQQQIQYGFGLAIPKSALSQPGPDGKPNFWQELHAEALTMFPGAQQIPPSFSLKYKDGDGVDDKGVPFSQREGYAGCIVVACTTQLPPKFFRYENGQNILINEGIKCGDYVNVQLSLKAHPAAGAGKAGMYVNPQAVQFLGYGTEIINAPSGDQIFGAGAPPQMGSQTPIAPQGQIIPAGSPPPMPQYAPPQPAQLQQMPTPQAQPAYQPAAHHGVLPQQFQPPAGGQPMGNVAPMPGGFPAPAAIATPGHAPMPQPFATGAAPAPAPQQWQQPQGMPAMPPAPGQWAGQ